MGNADANADVPSFISAPRAPEGLFLYRNADFDRSGDVIPCFQCDTNLVPKQYCTDTTRAHELQARRYESQADRRQATNYELSQLY